jgi:hypothetical protein
LRALDATVRCGAQASTVAGSPRRRAHLLPDVLEHRRLEDMLDLQEADQRSILVT